MASSTSKAQGKRPVNVDDDSDIDELDDVLDDFSKKPSAQPTHQQATTSPPTKSTAPFAAPPDSSTESDEEAAKFAKEFARQMEDMLLELATTLDPSGSTGGASASGSKSKEETDPQKSPSVEKAVEQTGTGDETSTTDDFGDAFQTRLKAAMERLHMSDTQGNASEDPSDHLATLLGEEGDEEVQKLLENMMNHLMCKDVLYEPLKELDDKFPSYLASNEGKLSESDLARYKAQHVCTSKIVALFEDPGYKDDDPKMMANVVALMSEMQEHGTPPREIMGELPPGLDGPDGLPEELSDKCVVA